MPSFFIEKQQSMPFLCVCATQIAHRLLKLHNGGYTLTMWCASIPRVPAQRRIVVGVPCRSHRSSHGKHSMSSFLFFSFCEMPSSLSRSRSFSFFFILPDHPKKHLPLTMGSGSSFKGVGILFRLGISSFIRLMAHIGVVSDPLRCCLPVAFLFDAIGIWPFSFPTTHASFMCACFLRRWH